MKAKITVFVNDVGNGFFDKWNDIIIDVTISKLDNWLIKNSFNKSGLTEHDIFMGSKIFVLKPNSYDSAQIIIE